MRITLEVCVDTVDSALAAATGGADRIELCSSLEAGGLTPPLALLRDVRQSVALPIAAMARPRRGDFIYSDREFDTTCAAAGRLLDAGAAGIVFGFLDHSRRVCLGRTRDLVRRLGGHSSVFHRAIDHSEDPVAAIDVLIEAGVKRVLTSGGRDSAALGAYVVAAMVERANGRIEVMPGAGLDETNIAHVVRIAGATQVHGSFSRIVGGRRVTDAAKVAKIRRLLDDLNDASHRP